MALSFPISRSGANILFSSIKLTTRRRLRVTLSNIESHSCPLRTFAVARPERAPLQKKSDCPSIFSAIEVRAANVHCNESCHLSHQRTCPFQVNLVAKGSSFPSGIKALAYYVHGKGLKLGIYSDAEFTSKRDGEDYKQAEYDEYEEEASEHEELEEDPKPSKEEQEFHKDREKIKMEIRQGMKKQSASVFGHSIQCQVQGRYWWQFREGKWLRLLPSFTNILHVSCIKYLVHIPLHLPAVQNECSV